MEKRRILFLIPSLVGGGAERTLINLLQKIDYNKYNIDLVSVLNKGTYLTQVPEKVRLITLFNNELLLRILVAIKRKTGFDLIFRLKMQTKVKGHYDVGISFIDSAFTEFLNFSKRINKRYAFVHSSYKTYENYAKFFGKRQYREHVKKYRYSKLDGLRFVSKDSMDEFIEIFGKYQNMQVIYNIINKVEVQRKANDEIIFEKKNFTFIALGSLLPVKGYERLIRSSRIVADKGFDFNLIILGTGSQKKQLQKLIFDLGLDNKIKLLGFISNPYPYMMKSDVFVMSSISEALPTALCEAMILGKPTLVTNCSGCREIVNMGEFGLMAEQDDIDIAKKMINYINKKQLREYYRSKSLERAKIFDDTKILEEYYKIFDS